MRGKIALIGATGLGLLDYQTTPLGERIPGIEIHAQILEGIFDDNLLHRPGVSRCSWSALLLLAAAV